MVNMPNQLNKQNGYHIALGYETAEILKTPTTAQETALHNLLNAVGMCGAEDMYLNVSTAQGLQHDNRLHMLQLTLQRYLIAQGEGFEGQ